MTSKASKAGVVKKVGQDDLRRLMKQHKTNKKIDSPLAKYNTLGQLVCIVCQQQVKSEVLWNAHLQGRTHKEKHETWKSRKFAPQPSAAAQIHTAKRQLEQKGYAAAFKKSKVEDNANTDTAPSGLAARLGLASYSDSESSEDERKTPEEAEKPAAGGDANNEATSSGLPGDFFDAPPQPGESQKLEPDVEQTPAVKKMADTLPEGFFDNPVEDAKARQIVYVDKKEAEWAQFQKEMKTETKVSEELQAEVDEELQEERDIGQIDEQMEKWSRVNQLQDAKEVWSSTSKDARTVDDSGDSDVPSDEDLMDWRSKGAWRS